MIFIFNKPELKSKRKRLRNEMTEAEKKLWSHLRDSQIGYKFRRQYSIGSYITDFYCPEKRLAIELDGSQHMKQELYDKIREEYFKKQNINTLRYWNNDILNNIDGALEDIKQKLDNL